jgi:hypothetical protein
LVTSSSQREIFGPDLVLEAEEKVRVIKKNLEAAQARQKSYHDKRRKPLQFEVGDHVYLKVSPTKGVQRFGIKAKLAPRYIGPYEIRETCGPVAYQLYSTYLSYESVSAYPRKCYLNQNWRSNQTCLIKRTLSRYWTKRKEQLEQGQFECIRFSGATTPKKRLHGRLRIFYVLASLTFCLKESVRNPKHHPHLPFESKYKKTLVIKSRVSCGNKSRRTSF